MLKAIILTLIIFYVFARFAGFFFRVIFWILGKFSNVSSQKVYYFGDTKVIVPEKRKQKLIEENDSFDDFQEVK
ncbi:MAG: hypothetical protein NZ521_05925 [Flammeovirgaceae bacterium]|nr:hypothetical protein [Flammeovirgaceae bacterium]MDW8287771.1 hypothetical protein [Flammeovirgaceae bacterium]